MSDMNQDTSSQGDEPLSNTQDAKLSRKISDTGLGLIALLIAGFAVAAFQASWHARAMALLWALASLALGYVGGFLFAVPRAARGTVESRHSDDGIAAANTASTGEPGLQINTNLEEISDWLTKIIVGLGLVELRSMPKYMGHIGRYVGRSLGPNMDSAASGILLYFLFLGFVAGYLMTRMFFSPAFLLADRATRVGPVGEIALEARAIASSAKALTKINSDVDTAMEELTRKPLQLGRIDQLIDLLNQHRKSYPLKRKLNIVLGRLYAEGKQQFDKGIDVLQEFVSAKKKVGEVDIDVADALFNVGCYYSLELSQTKGEQRSGVAQKAIDALRESVRINPRNEIDIATDPDLSELRDSEFKSLLQQLLNLTNPNHVDPPQ